MRTPLLLLFITVTIAAKAQITTPVIKAGFGVDGELRTNYFNGFVQSGNEDWFNNGTAGTGQFVIDTTGAAAIVKRYSTDPAYRKLPFYRTMKVPQFSIVNNRIWIDAVYIRDYNGQAGGDSTAFVMSNKNGDSPAAWDGGPTSVLDKNDIGEMMAHVRRAGPNKSDSLWFIGGISLQGTTGNRYFDFEMYQTDIFYSRSTGKFTNYGPDAGHTSWKFDAAGNIITPGDVIFTAEYSSSSLTLIEARVWVDSASLRITPTAFDWAGAFDGASTGCQFGYANIKPKTAGNYYTGLQSNNGTWAGPFGFIDGGNNYLTTYTARQFMEFSVNLTKLGLDPISLLGGSACGLPFRRILVKTRSSTSFTSELKDFIGPFDFFDAPPVEAAADVPLFCGTIGTSTLSVTNAASANVYNWTTTNGHIYGDSTGSSITVDQPGTYIVTQQLLDGCSTYAADTLTIAYDSTCIPMENSLTSFSGDARNGMAQLSWTTRANNQTRDFELQRSTNGSDFEAVRTIQAVPTENGVGIYGLEEDITSINTAFVFYRLKIRSLTGKVAYSGIVRLGIAQNQKEVLLFPNPVSDVLQMSVPSSKKEEARISVFDFSGGLIYSGKALLNTGSNTVQVNTSGWNQGGYLVHISSAAQNTWKKFVVNRNSSNTLNK